jgi:hypothetical protein
MQDNYGLYQPCILMKFLEIVGISTFLLAPNTYCTISPVDDRLDIWCLTCPIGLLLVFSYSGVLFVANVHFFEE